MEQNHSWYITYPDPYNPKTTHRANSERTPESQTGVGCGTAIPISKSSTQTKRTQREAMRSIRTNQPKKKGKKHAPCSKISTRSATRRAHPNRSGPSSGIDSRQLPHEVTARKCLSAFLQYPNRMGQITNIERDPKSTVRHKALTDYGRISWPKPPREACRQQSETLQRSRLPGRGWPMPHCAAKNYNAGHSRAIENVRSETPRAPARRWQEQTRGANQ